MYGLRPKGAPFGMFISYKCVEGMIDEAEHVFETTILSVGQARANRALVKRLKDMLEVMQA